MSTFRHHPDGWIYLDSDAYALSFFQQQEPAYLLPTDAISRYYAPNDRHTLSDGSSQWAGELPWSEGDRYLSNKASYAAAFADTQVATPMTPAQDWDAFRTAMLTDADYQKMLVTVMSNPANAWLGATMQQAISMPNPSIALVAPLWHQIVSLAPPSLEAVQRWRDYVSRTNVPIVFADDGALS